MFSIYCKEDPDDPKTIHLINSVFNYEDPGDPKAWFTTMRILIGYYENLTFRYEDLGWFENSFFCYKDFDWFENLIFYFYDPSNPKVGFT